MAGDGSCSLDQVANSTEAKADTIAAKGKLMEVCLSVPSQASAAGALHY